MSSAHRRQRGSPFRWRERTQRAVANRRVFPFLALATLSLGLAAGFVVTLIDRKDFPTFGTGVWWSIVTLGTVGYGDVVPHTAWGRVLGGILIVIGVTFISFLTATVTSYFVAAEQEESKVAEHEERLEVQAQTTEGLRRIEQRLTEIEAKLNRLG
jgi:voltage-gated potassium channel